MESSIYPWHSVKDFLNRRLVMARSKNPVVAAVAAPAPKPKKKIKKGKSKK